MRKKLLNDAILVLILLLAAISAWGIVKLTQKSGEYVVVEIDGTETARYPLDKDVRIEIPSEDGHFNVLVIKDGKAVIESADCPRQLCVKQRPIGMTGECIVCLPHKLVIRIEGGSGVDTVS